MWWRVRTDEGVLAAELEDDGCEVGRGALHDALADGRRADEQNLVDAGLDEGRPRLALVHEQRDELRVVAGTSFNYVRGCVKEMRQNQVVPAVMIGAISAPQLVRCRHP
jgi:hypothetical protein